jgi:hypothetical protein
MLAIRHIGKDGLLWHIFCPASESGTTPLAGRFVFAYTNPYTNFQGAWFEAYVSLLYLPLPPVALPLVTRGRAPPVSPHQKTATPVPPSSLRSTQR